jgi:D-alanyl-D-alanine dipeptidase
MPARPQRLPIAAAALLAACASAPRPSAAPPASLAEAGQLVVVTTAGWDSITGELRRYVREGGEWRREGGVVPIVVGRTGLAWGVGLDALAAAPGTAGPRKHEGDGRSPAGVFAIPAAFGFTPRDSMSAIRLPYVPLTPATECVDDTASSHYNAVLERTDVSEVDWRSSEVMRKVSQYRLGMLVDYNAAPAVKGRGSCIFFHIWAGPRQPTVGCTALEERELAALVAWLDPDHRPAFVQLPAAVYANLRHAWALPPLSP